MAAEFGPLLLDAFDNTDFAYPVDPDSGVSADEVNQAVIRITGDPQVRNADPNLSPDGRSPRPSTYDPHHRRRMGAYL